MRQGNPLPHAEPLHLVKEKSMGGIHLVPAVAATRSDHFDRGFPLLQHPDLDR